MRNIYYTVFTGLLTAVRAIRAIIIMNFFIFFLKKFNYAGHNSIIVSTNCVAIYKFDDLVLKIQNKSTLCVS